MGFSEKREDNKIPRSCHAYLFFGKRISFTLILFLLRVSFFFGVSLEREEAIDRTRGEVIERVREAIERGLGEAIDGGRGEAMDRGQGEMMERGL
eukprot:1328845-Amorphochlora_amoeboformis.AAC.1